MDKNTRLNHGGEVLSGKEIGNIARIEVGKELQVTMENRPKKNEIFILLGVIIFSLFSCAPNVLII